MIDISIPLFSVPKIHHSRIPTAKLFPRDNIKLRKQIVNVHNRLRSSVRPTASNMLRMVSCDGDMVLVVNHLYCRLGTRRRPRWLRATLTSAGASHTTHRQAAGPGGSVAAGRTSSSRHTKSPGHSQSSPGSRRRISSVMAAREIIWRRLGGFKELC